MNQAREALSNIWHRFQTCLFPSLEEAVGPLTKRQQQLVEVLDVVEIERHIPYTGCGGRPLADRCAIGRAFIAKAVYNMATTEVLLDHLESDIRLRRICGWGKSDDVPSQSTFSRAFAEFAETQLPERVHAAVIDAHLGEQLVGHISRDSTEIIAREKPKKQDTAGKEPKKPKKRGRPKKGEERTKELTRIEKQASGTMSLEEMTADLPTACDVGSKRDSKGHNHSWVGYKLHFDTADGGIPVSCILTSASMHDSQAAIPLAKTTYQRVTNCYDLMDSAYDCVELRDHSRSLGHIPIIDVNPRSRKAEIENEQKARRKANYKLAEDVRYNERSTVERINGRLKDEFGGRMVRVKGHAKVMAHLMFGVLVLTADQLMKFVE
uniref:Transposase domain (DUF772) n=1 Tax=Candidatus Kentrum sp. FM TaxID=2126340 RepID=A0A450U0R8_9GAMM|nr:MAG: Transposase domain (DUF772) [Candidatus Kentron sp. FM]VFJ75903.1 MAG: Transposase domain (DUF772) [Candidatus Kentron sp. FM]VFK22708.1 MAG: Transposase domain (DUF772) [Candidatus Kentron sp. FM]